VDDLEFSRRVLQGDRDANAEFVERHYASVFRYLRVLTSHDQEAEDLAQETLLKARLRLTGYRGKSSLRSWIHSVAFRQFLRWRRLRRLSFRLNEKQSYVPDGFADAETGETLRIALAHLSEGQRQAFVLHEILKFDLPEVASALKTPVGTVKSRLFHARIRLRAALTPKTEEASHGTKAYEH